MSRVVGDRTVLLNLQTGTYLSLTGTAARLWHLLDQLGEEGAVSTASAEYDVPPERIAEDLHALQRQVGSLRAERQRTGVRRVRLPTAARLVQLPARAWLAVLQTALLAAAVEVGMRLMPLPRLAELTGMRLSFDAPGDEAKRPAVLPHTLSPSESLHVWATDRVYARWPFGDTCLRRALVLGFHLRRDSPLLRIGVAGKDAASLDSTAAGMAPVAAHAWVETARATLLALPDYESLTTASEPLSTPAS